jgi:stress response protein SCP2
LDVLCVLYGVGGEVKEVIHPGNPRSRNESVVHTGDSRNGAGTWDDECIFIFLGAVPADIGKLAFMVISASRHTFDEVPGAVCHMSDRASETELLRTDLASFSGRVTCTVAALQRDASAWRIVRDAELSHDGLPVEVQTLLETDKQQVAPAASGRRRGSFGRKP